MNLEDNVNVLKYFSWDIQPISKDYQIYARRTFNEVSNPHKHEYIEFFYVTKGQGIHIFNGQSSVIETGNAFILTQGDTHGFRLIENKEFHHMDILIKTDFFKNVCDFFYPTLYDDFTSKKMSQMFTLSSEQISAFNNYIPFILLPPNNMWHVLSSKEFVTSIIQLMINNYSSKSNEDVPDWVIQLLAKLNNPDNFTYSVSDLTQEFSYNPDYIRRVFKKKMGMTMTEYFNHRKIDHAYQLLQTTNYTVEEICELIGIDNLSHFYHQFKDTYHKTPLEIKKISTSITDNF